MSELFGILCYVLSVFVAAYIGCRVAGDSWPAPFALGWPFFYPLFLFVAILMWIANLAEDHSA
jgi:hypothetical protein